jgi:hypothetical protein
LRLSLRKVEWKPLEERKPAPRGEAWVRETLIARAAVALDLLQLERRVILKLGTLLARNHALTAPRT